MHTIPDLGIPEVKPAIELYRGVPRQKVSPRFTHANLQARIAALLSAWAEGRGRVGTEWRFSFIEHDGAPNSSLVPDVAYVSFARLPYEALEEAERPTLAPDIAIEIRSPDDVSAHVEEKIALYLACGSSWVVLVDPQSRAIDVYDRANDRMRTFAHGEIALIAADFTLDLAALFAPLAAPNC